MQAKQYLKSHAKAAVLALALPLALTSCSKQQDAAPAPQAVSASAGVSVLNGRVVFADQQAFEQTLASLNKMAGQGDNARAFDAWEQGLNFASLRKAADREEAHLEALETNGTPTPAHALMASFGFPTAFAAFLNPAGEYQVGQKVYWFHDGFQYEAASVADLAAIKLNPAAATAKTAAGAHIVKHGTVENGVLTPAKGAGNGLVTTNNTNVTAPYVDGKYLSSFYLLDDRGSARRIIYDLQAFTYNAGGAPQGSIRYSTTINLQINYQYYNDSRRAWYRADGQQFDYNFDLAFYATVSDPINDYVTVPRTTLSTSSTYTGGFASYTLGSVYITATSAGVQPESINWNIDLYGVISGNDRRDTAHRYTIGYIGYGGNGAQLY